MRPKGHAYYSNMHDQDQTFVLIDIIYEYLF